MVLYCDSNRVQAGEYLYEGVLSCDTQYRNLEADSLGRGDRVSNVGSFEILQGYDDSE
jgi:hypothetical protein